MLIRPEHNSHLSDCNFHTACCTNIVLVFYEVILSRHELLMYILHFVQLGNGMVLYGM